MVRGQIVEQPCCCISERISHRKLTYACVEMISGNKTISNHQSDYSDKVSQDQSDGMLGQQLEQKPKSKLSITLSNLWKKWNSKGDQAALKRLALDPCSKNTCMVNKIGETEIEPMSMDLDFLMCVKYHSGIIAELDEMWKNGFTKETRKKNVTKILKNVQALVQQGEDCVDFHNSAIRNSDEVQEALHKILKKEFNTEWNQLQTKLIEEIVEDRKKNKQSTKESEKLNPDEVTKKLGDEMCKWTNSEDLTKRKVAEEWTALKKEWEALNSGKFTEKLREKLDSFKKSVDRFQEDHVNNAQTDDSVDELDSGFYASQEEEPGNELDSSRNDESTTTSSTQEKSGDVPPPASTLASTNSTIFDTSSWKSLLEERTESFIQSVRRRAVFVKLWKRNA